MNTPVSPNPPFQDPQVEAIFQAYPPKVRQRLLALRSLIFDTAEELDGVGPIEEALRWGERVAYEGKRALVLRLDEEPPVELLRVCVGLALTYKRRRRKRR